MNEFNENIESIINENEKKVENFLNNLPNPINDLAIKYFGKINLTSRDKTKYHGNTRARYQKIADIEKELDDIRTYYNFE